VRVLVTGSSGNVGRYVVPTLVEAGHDVIAFDLVTGGDVRDADAAAAVVCKVDAIVHLAAVAWDFKGGDAEVLATNVGGTSNLLAAAVGSRVRRFVYASSVNALGVFMGLRAPDYLPIDDDHPCYGTSPYGISKLLGEELCALATRTTGLSTICLRLPRVIEPGQYSVADARYTEGHGWEYGAFIDARDVARAMLRAVDVSFKGHERVLVGSSDAMGVTPPIQIADRLFPLVPWTSRVEFEADLWRPLVRTERAQALLGWSPAHAWTATVDVSPPPRRSLPSRVLRRVRATLRTRG
jgi:UDP-glucose 4-epimerase